MPHLPLDMLENLGGVVFDCDGVLIDSLEANAAYYNLFRRHFGLPDLTAEQKGFVHSAAVRESLGFILPGIPWDDIEAYSRSLDYRQVLPDLVLEPGLRELLALLRDDLGLKLAVNTNRTNSMHLVIDHFGLHGYFDPVVQAGDVARPKPDPEGLLRIRAAWGLPHRSMLFVGDSAVDEATALAAGIPFAAYKNPALRQAMVHVPDFPSLSASLARKRA